MFSISPFKKLDVLHASLFLMFASERHHLVGHIDPVHLSHRADNNTSIPPSSFLSFSKWWESVELRTFTITGSVANIIVVERVRPDVIIGFREWLSRRLPIPVVTLFFGCAWLTLVR
jgi:hypothetical protein